MAKFPHTYMHNVVGWVGLSKLKECEPPPSSLNLPLVIGYISALATTIHRKQDIQQNKLHRICSNTQTTALTVTLSTASTK